MAGLAFAFDPGAALAPRSAMLREAMGGAVGALTIAGTRGSLASYQDRPADYARDVLGVAWWQKQVEIAESVRVNRRTVVYAGHSVGKTHLAAGLVQWHFDVFNPSITLTTAPSWSSIHDLLWGEIAAQRKPDALGRLLEM